MECRCGAYGPKTKRGFTPRRNKSLKTMVYKTEDDQFIIHIPPRIVNRIIESAVLARPNEFAGVLVGFFTQDLDAAIITEVLNHCAWTARTRANIDVDIINDKLAEIWEQSKGREFFLGYWHSHPDNEATPTDIDDDNFRFDNIEEPEVFSLIIGRAFSPEDLKVYLYVKDAENKKVDRLSLERV